MTVRWRQRDASADVTNSGFSPGKICPWASSGSWDPPSTWATGPALEALNLFINYVITTDPANVEYILKKNFAYYGKITLSSSSRRVWASLAVFPDMGKKTQMTKKPGKGKEKATKAEEKRARRETRSSHLRMTSMPFW
ncbi:unnamed protein product [Prunus armeniaca]